MTSRTAPPTRAVRSVAEGLPTKDSGWPEGVRDACQKFRQGDVVSEPPLHYFADPRYAMWALTKAYTDSSQEPEVVLADEEYQPLFGVVVTQTCDIAEEFADAPSRPWIQIAPAYDYGDVLNSGLKGLLRDGYGPSHLVHLPRLPDGFWVCDLRITVPVEKSWLVGREPIEGFADEISQNAIGDRLAMLYSRPAFASNLNEIVEGSFVQKMKNLKHVDSALYNKIGKELRELGARVDSRLAPTDVALSFFTDDTVSDDVSAWLMDWHDGVMAEGLQQGITFQPLRIRRLADVNASEYLNHVVVTLGRLSRD